MPGNKPVVGRGIDTGMPCIYHSSQDTEEHNRHGDTQHSQSAPQLVPAYVT